MKVKTEEMPLPDLLSTEDPPIAVPDMKQVCERTFVTFTEDRDMDAVFHRIKVTPPLRNICPITR